MTTTYNNTIERDWVRLGVLLNCEPSDETPDLERLLLDTARRCPNNARLFPLTVTWLVSFDQYVARHRLRRLVIEELEPEYQAQLGLLIETAVEQGATRDLLIVSEVCQRASNPHPLHVVQQESEVLRQIAFKNATALSRQWGVWAPAVVLKRDAVRPVTWLLHHNPDYRERIVRKGDLRVSILETLQRDCPTHSVSSELALARLAGATRTAVRKALHALTQEGMVTVAKGASHHHAHPVALRKVA